MYAVACTILVAGSGLVGWSSMASGASNLPNGGVATLVQGSGATALATNTPLPSNTLFDVRLPSGSVCSSGGGNGTQVGSFLVPEGAALGNLTVGSNSTASAAGVVDQGVALATAGGLKAFDNAQSTPSGAILSADLSGFEMDGLIAGGLTVGPGAQLPLPNTNLIAAGKTTADYEAGIVCFGPTNHETDFWAAPITFTIAANDPGGKGFEWSVRTASSATTTTTSTTTPSTTTSTTTPSTTSTTHPSTTTTSTTSTTTPHGATTTTLACGATNTTTSTTSTTSSTSTTSTTSSTSSTTAPTTTSTTVPCTTTTTSAASGSSTTASGAASPTSSGGVAVQAANAINASGASSGLPFTGRNAARPLMFGVVLVMCGLMLLGAARRRQEVERLIWPDQRSA